MKKLSRKDRKRRADRKRALYYNKIADKAIELVKSVYFDKSSFARVMDEYVHTLVRNHHLDAHIIRQAGREYARTFNDALRNQTFKEK